MPAAAVPERLPGSPTGDTRTGFSSKLIAGGFATTDLSAPAHAGRLYHLQYKPWYRLLGEPDHRYRRAMSVGRAVERLVVLDGVLAEPDVTWLGLVRDKVATFTTPPFCVPADALPRTTVGGVVRPFPDPPPEDILLQKLRWYRLGGGVSDRQWRDIAAIVRVQAASLDRAYLRDGADLLGVTDLLERALGEAPPEG